MKIRFFTSTLAFLGLIACSPERPDTTPIQSGPLDQVVETYAQIVHATYVDSLNAAEVMSSKIEAFLAAPNEQSLMAAKESWISARLPYLQTEVYRFYDGPIDDKDGPEGQLNAWPMDEAYVDYVMGMPGAGVINDKESYPEITKNLIIALNEKDGEENISCGYHAIEFLLWGQDLRVDGPGNRPHADYTSAANADRRKAFLSATVALLLEDLQGLVNEWAPSKENYRAGFVE
ncbi:MAG: iron-regulated protein, partial [Verrucomicrobiaceae bacterium]|nr:iron-regulated protein [Verrucomicrobiaceae bacterium]